MAALIVFLLVGILVVFVGAFIFYGAMLLIARFAGAAENVWMIASLAFVGFLVLAAIVLLL